MMRYMDLRRFLAGIVHVFPRLIPLAVVKESRILLVCGYCVCCASCFDSSGPRSYTEYKLKELAVVMEKVSFEEAERITTAKDILDLGFKKRWIKVDTLASDGWNRPWHFEAKRQGECLLMQLVSAGKNGVLESGAGDDMFVEVTYCPSGEITVRYSK